MNESATARENELGDSFWLDYLRSRRHAFFNDLQIIQGFSQLGKAGETLRQVKAAIARLLTESMVCRLEPPDLMRRLFIKMKEAEDRAVGLFVTVEGEERAGFAVCLGPAVTRLIDAAFTSMDQQTTISREIKLTFKTDAADKGLEVVFPHLGPEMNQELTSGLAGVESLLASGGVRLKYQFVADLMHIVIVEA